jgi:hypothetical protein
MSASSATTACSAAADGTIWTPTAACPFYVTNCVKCEHPAGSPQHPHSHTTTQPPGRHPSPPSTSTASSGTTTPVSDFERDISDFAQDVSDFGWDVSDFVRDFYAAGASDWSKEHNGGPMRSSSSSPSASRSARTGPTINVIHKVTRDQNHSFDFSFWGITWAFFGKHGDLTILYISGGY